MKKPMAELFLGIRRFHRNESGANTLEVILILALAVIAAVAIYKFGGIAVEFLYDCLYGFPGY